MREDFAAAALLPVLIKKPRSAKVVDVCLTFRGVVDVAVN